MTKKQRQYNQKRYQNDLRAIRKSTGAGYREAQSLYREVRDLAGGRPVRDRLVKSSVYRHGLRDRFRAGQEDREAPPAAGWGGGERKTGTEKADVPTSEIRRMIEKLVGLGISVSLTAPFLSTDYAGAKGDDPLAQQTAAAAGVEVWREAKAYMKGEGVGKDGKFAGGYWFDFAWWRFEWSLEMDEASMIWIGPGGGFSE